MAKKRVVLIPEKLPYASLAASLEAVPAWNKRRLILNFCSRHGVSEQSVVSRLKPYDGKATSRINPGRS